MNFLSAMRNYKIDLGNIIKNAYKNAEEYLKIKEKLKGKSKGKWINRFLYGSKDLLTYKNQLYVPNLGEFKHLILNELHKKSYSRHRGYHRMITMLIKYYNCPNMKNDNTNYLYRCLECQQVQTEH